MESKEFESQDEVAQEPLEDLGDEFDDDSDDESDEFENESDEDVASDDSDHSQKPGKPVIAMSTLPVTGEARVDDALARLKDLESLPVHEHVEVFEDVQRRLHETLADISGQ
jgi:hypothetical protein